MHTIQSSQGSTGWYHECAQDNCRRHYHESGSSPSPGWVSQQKHTRCPRCGSRVTLHISLNRLPEHRIVRQGDGQTVERFPATPSGLARAQALLEKLA